MIWINEPNLTATPLHYPRQVRSKKLKLLATIGLFMAMPIVGTTRTPGQEIPHQPEAQGPEHTGAQGLEHKVPASYNACVRRAATIIEHVETLRVQDRFFQMHEPLELLDEIIKSLPHKLDADVNDPLRRKVTAAASQLKEIAEDLDASADQEETAQYSIFLGELPPIVEELSDLSQLSIEEIVVFSPPAHNVPNTYGRSVRRLKGVLNALREAGQTGQLYEVHELTEHVFAVAEHLPQITEIDLIAPVRLDVTASLNSLRAVSDTLHKAADVDDPAPFASEINRGRIAVRELRLTAREVWSAIGIDDTIGSGIPTDHISELLERAEHHQTQHRLTRPAGRNAYDIYQEVLSLDPDNQEAVAGLRDMTEWYILHASEHAQEGETVKAATYYRRALMVDPNSVAAYEGLKNVTE